MNLARLRTLKPQILAIAAALSLAACATPSTQRPLVSAEEIQAEQDAQHNAALNNPFPPIVEPVYPNKKMKDRLQRVAARVNPQASKLCYELRGQPRDDLGCHYSLAIKGTRGVNAYATGQDVIISAPMMVFAANDTHLAFVLAHELAHNIMDHINLQTSNVLVGAVLGSLADIAAGAQGASTGGTFGEMGAQMGLETYSPSFEAEADYIALYILARAGYRIEEAPNFWRAMAQYEPQGIYARSTHPTTAERFVGMGKTIAEIRAKQRAGQPLIPNIRQRDS
jgi:predicted Zn-dependent protease